MDWRLFIAIKSVEFTLCQNTWKVNIILARSPVVTNSHNSRCAAGAWGYGQAYWSNLPSGQSFLVRLLKFFLVLNINFVTFAEWIHASWLVTSSACYFSSLVQWWRLERKRLVYVPLVVWQLVVAIAKYMLSNLEAWSQVSTWFLPLATYYVSWFESGTLCMAWWRSSEGFLG